MVPIVQTGMIRSKAARCSASANEIQRIGYGHLKLLVAQGGGENPRLLAPAHGLASRLVRSGLISWLFLSETQRRPPASGTAALSQPAVSARKLKASCLSTRRWAAQPRLGHRFRVQRAV